MIALATRCRQCACVGLALEGVQAHGAVVAVKDPVVQGVQALALVLLAARRATA